MSDAVDGETRRWDRDRPSFEPTSAEQMALDEVKDSSQRKILETLLKIEKKIEYVLPVAESAYRIARRHDKVLSPIVQLVTWASGAVAFAVGIFEVVKALKGRP